jgi:choline dehydrogenase-like flavoprotein
MIVDARSLPDGHQLDADLCIVGAGPAGLTVAHELRDAGLSICIVESGPERPAPAYEALNLADAPNSDLAPPDDTRARALGGTAHRWDVFTGGLGRRVRYLPLSPIDLEPRPWVPDSGWPLTPADLAPHLDRARVIAGLPRRALEPSEAPTASRPLLPLDPACIRTTIEWFGRPERFHTELPRALATEPGITVLTHATAVAIRTERIPGSVSGLSLRTLEGRRLGVRAHRFVLATGGIENARLLLASRDTHPEGIGNQHDLVGRYYVDHIKLVVADLVPTDPLLVDRLGFYDIHRAPRPPGGASEDREAVIAGKLQLADRVQRDDRLLDAAVRLEPRPPAAVVAAAAAGRRLLSDARHRRPRASSLGSLLRSAPGLPALARLAAELAIAERTARPSITHGWSRVAHPSRRYDRFQLELQLELAPNPANRVTLSPTVDPLGSPRAAITWRWGDLERHTIRRTIHHLAEAFATRHLAAVTLRDESAFEVITPAGDHHPSGTTRMHPDPARGVVDADCRVHGIDNLYVTGSSVFPTVGYANPTLTIVALASRLAAHLAQTT